MLNAPNNSLQRMADRLLGKSTDATHPPPKSDGGEGSSPNTGDVAGLGQGATLPEGKPRSRVYCVESDGGIISWADVFDADMELF